MGVARNGKLPPEPEVMGYCVHCRSRRLMRSAIQVCNRRGGRDLKGHCDVCGKSMYRLGGWDAVATAAQKAQAAIREHSAPSSDEMPAPVESALTTIFD